MAALTENQLKSFWSKVNTANSASCWEWKAALTSTGYGQFTVSGGKNWRAHRLAYELTKGPIPPGMVIMHSCDNRRCVNPAHLAAGTQKQNLIQMAIRNRKPTAVLTAEDVRECRERARSGETIQSIADSYSVKHVTISAAIRGRTWKHISDPPPVPPGYRRTNKSDQRESQRMSA